jgi:serine palmitoyltransferase
MLEPSDLSSLAKMKESITFARAYFHTWIRDRVEPHHALSGAGDFAHFIVNPLYEWYGHNKRILTSQPLRRVCLKEAQKQNSTISFINCSSYNYVGTYSMSQEYEWLQRRCLDTLPIANAAAVGLMHSALEAEIASHFGAEYCVTAATGYQANVVTLTAILDKSWVVILDEKSHSSLFTATHLSQVGMRKKFKHNDMADLNKVLDEVTGHLPNIMVVVEGVYR